MTTTAPYYVTDVQPTTNGHGLFGHGFNLGKSRMSSPAISFVYKTEEDAKEARELVLEALVKVVAVLP